MPLLRITKTTTIMEREISPAETTYMYSRPSGNEAEDDDSESFQYTSGGEEDEVSAEVPPSEVPVEVPPSEVPVEVSPSELRGPSRVASVVPVVAAPEPRRGVESREETEEEKYRREVSPYTA